MANPTVLLETTSGDILIELYADKAPATVENFLKYVNEGFYANTIFHRVIKGFMIQGGGMNMKMEEKATHAPIKNEADNGLANPRSPQRHGPVLHQHRGQRVPELLLA